MVFNMVQALREQMNDPCIECVVAPCCSKRCVDFAKYVYETKQYVNAGLGVARRIQDMSYDEAIEHIIKVESVYLYMKLLDQKPL